MTTLDTIGLQHGTDKASNDHNYLSFYENFFAPLRERKISVLEIGVLGGASLRTWEEYFTAAKIVGADIDPAAKSFESDRVTIEILDQSNIEELTRTAIKHGPFDIIIEDGSHFWEHQITSLRTLFPFLKHGGIYIVEDLQTNYGALKESYRGIASLSCMDYLKSLVDLRVGDHEISIETIEDAFLRTYGRNIEFITFFRHACLIKKQFPPVSREVMAGYPLAADHTDGRAVAVRITAHISDKGDIFGASGFVNLGPDEFSIQGFTILNGEPLLEYRALEEGETIWSDWRANNEFVGTRGQSKPLIGFAVRLKSQVSADYRLRVFGRFAGSTEPVEARDGEDCVSGFKKPLCGIQIEITERAG